MVEHKKPSTVLHLGTVLMLTYLPMALFAVGIAASMPILIATLDASTDQIAAELSNPEILDAMRSYNRQAELPFLFATAIAGLFAALGAFTTYWARNHLEGRIRAIAEFVESIGGQEKPPPLADIDISDSLGRLARDMDRIAQQIRQRDIKTRVEANRQKFEAQLQSGLAMAHNEDDIIRIVGLAMDRVGADRPTQLLLAESEEADLHEAIASPSGNSPSCPVRTPHECIAVRQGHAMSFEDGRALDACPKLLERSEPAQRGLCVPLSIMGNTVGILHSTSKKELPFSTEQEEMYQSIARNVSSRLGMVRALRTSQQQAETDPLTGLINRRSLDTRFQQLSRTNSVISVVMCDLDHFKHLNDTYGHDAGDRALSLFAQVIQKLIRPQDLAARFGGEEFVIVFPDTTLEQTAIVVERIRASLKIALQRTTVPSFTASFGLASAPEHGRALGTLAEAADQAMYRAKANGRDCIVRAHMNRGEAEDNTTETGTPDLSSASNTL